MELTITIDDVDAAWRAIKPVLSREKRERILATLLEMDKAKENMKNRMVYLLCSSLDYLMNGN